MSFELPTIGSPSSERSQGKEEVGGCADPERRRFLRATVGTGISASALLSGCATREFSHGSSLSGISVTESGADQGSINEGVAQEGGYWYGVVSEIYERIGVQGRLQWNARRIVNSIGIVSGETVSLSDNPERDKAIAPLTHDENIQHWLYYGLYDASDFRLRYPEGLPPEIEQHLTSAEQKIISLAYREAAQAHEKPDRVIPEMLFYRLPGGTSVFMRGVEHDAELNASRTMAYNIKMGREADVVALESYVNVPYGYSVHSFFENDTRGDEEDYFSYLAHGLVEGGRHTRFLEVDMRNSEKLNLGGLLSHDFYRSYFAFLQEEHPQSAQKVGSAENLQAIHKLNDDQQFDLISYPVRSVRGGYKDQRGLSVDRPQGYEIDQIHFSDAMAAIKLHLVDRLIQEGVIKQGVIMEFRGARHLHTTHFFLKNPEYAMEVVMMSLPEVLSDLAYVAYQEEYGFLDGEIYEGKNVALAEALMRYIEQEKFDWAEVLDRVVSIALFEYDGDVLSEGCVSMADVYTSLGVDRDMLATELGADAFKEELARRIKARIE